MLNTFNNLIKSILFEQVENDAEKENIMKAYNSNEFFLTFLVPSAAKADVQLTKQADKIFLVCGEIEKVKMFFKNLKVDKTYMDKPADFKIYSPIFTFGEITGQMKLDQYYPIDNLQKTGIPMTHELQNFNGGEMVEGPWYAFKDEEKNIKGIKPTDLSKEIDKLNKDEATAVIYIEFQINVDLLKNVIWDEMTEYAPTNDEMNEKHNEDPEDFDYSQMNAKNEDDEKIVKKSLIDNKINGRRK